MNSAQLLNHFDQIGEAPNAIPRLRRFILALAVRGKLVEQDPRDEPASQLLKHIQAENERLVKAGKIKKLETLPSIEPEEVPFEVPTHWNLVRIGESLELINGRAFKPNEWSKVGLPIIRIQNLNNTDASFNYCEAPIPEKFHVKTGDFLISWSGTPGTSFGAHIWDRGNALLNQHIFKAELIGKAFLPHFLKLAINSRLLELIDQAQGGVGLQHITKPKLEMLPLTLPPLAEQHRIVAKFDELMALCDRLEAAQSERESRRDRLVASSLHRLNNGTDPDAFREHATFYFNHLPRLTTRPDHLKQLRQTILNLAVRGKLVEQDPTDESTFYGLRRLQPNISNLEFNRENEEPSGLGVRYLLPENWAWLKGHRIANFIDPQPSHRTPPEYPTGIPYIGYADILNTGGVDFLNARKVSPTILEEHRKRYTLQTGDFVIGKIGTIGKPFLLPSPFDYTLSANIILIQPNKHLVSPSYLMAFINSPIAETALGLHKTDSTHAVFGIKKARDLLIPVPPLAEQHRIVAKVDELMALCDQLETQLTTTQSESRHLLESILHEAIAVA